MKRVLLLLVILFSFNSFYSGATSNKDIIFFEKHYNYPITQESADWFEYTILEKAQLLKIPKETLGKMSDVQLMYAIADYPLFGDIYAYGIDGDGLDTFASFCSAFEELRSRDTFLTTLKNEGLRIAQEYEADSSGYFNSLRSHVLEDLVKYYTSSSELHRDTPLIVYTPNGSAVQALIREEIHDGEPYHYNCDQYYISTYAVTPVYSGTCIYNCHSFAWSLPSPSNPYWINNPTPYMADGSYSLKYSGSINNPIGAYGVSYYDKVYYPNQKHSALIIGITTSSTIPLASITVVSKWGPHGVFQHAVGNVPPGFYSSTVSIWH